MDLLKRQSLLRFIPLPVALSQIAAKRTQRQQPKLLEQFKALMHCKQKVSNPDTCRNSKQNTFRNSAVLLLLMVCASFNSYAVWFEATGQAIIRQGNKELARAEATEEAIKQALLFAGASVNSVQTMANGLLKDDRFEIRSTGEVNHIELIDEVYHGDYISVSIRADIFPQDQLCEASDYRKQIITTWMPLERRNHAVVGGIFDLGIPASEMLQEEFSAYSRFADITKLEPFFLKPEPSELSNQAMQLARKHGVQFVLLAAITELGIEGTKKSLVQKATFWKNKKPQRNVAIRATLIDGTTGEIVMRKVFREQASWEFDPHTNVDTRSTALWDSSFGNAIKRILQNIATQVDERVRCIPAYGRILRVNNNQIAADIGSLQGVKRGDQLTVFQMQQFFSPMGTPHYQYQIHPVRFEVTNVYHNTSLLRAMEDIPLTNIQPNDFVVRR